MKVILKDGTELKPPAPRGESAASWLTNIRRSGDKNVLVGNTMYPVQDIKDAVDEKSRKGQTSLGGI